MPKRGSGQKAREQKTKPDPAYEKALSNNAKATNPNYLESSWRGDEKYTHNCANCTYAFEARMRGEEVEAASKSDAMASKHWRDAMKGQTWEKLLGSDGEQTLESTEAFMRSQGPNARFAIEISYIGGGGHIFNAVNDGNGNPRFVEAQSGVELTREQMISRYEISRLSAVPTVKKTVKHYNSYERKFEEIEVERKVTTPQISRIDNLQFDGRYRRLWDAKKRKNQGYSRITMPRGYHE